MLLKPPPHTESISVAGPQGNRRYPVGADGLIRDVAADHLPQLLAAGCEAASVPAPKPAMPPKVRLRAPKPHMMFAPESGSTVRYTSDADAFVAANPEHVKALMRAGCVRV